MKASAFAPVTALLMAAVSAQVDNNPVDRNNRAYLVISTATHPTTLRNYLWSPMNPIEYAPAVLGGTGGTTGVPAGTESWRHIFGATNRRSSARQHTGWKLGMATSAASTSSGRGSRRARRARSRSSTGSGTSPTSTGGSARRGSRSCGSTGGGRSR